MANEFKVKNGLYVSGSATVINDATITGSLTVLNGITGSLYGFAQDAYSASYAQTADQAPYYVLTASYQTDSSSLSIRVTDLESTASTLTNASASFASDLTNVLSATASYATTASNTFVGIQYVSNTTDATSFIDNPALYTDGGLRVSKNTYVSGGLYVAGDLTVYGSSSVNYVTTSVLVGLEFVNLNTDLPALRYAGINVGDSGSAAGISSSFWYDSEKDNWLYVHAHAGADQTSSLAINGPITYNNLGNEQGLLANYITKAQLVTEDNNHHITSSQIYDDGTTVAIAGNLQVTGSLYALNLTGSLNGSNLIDGTVTNAKLQNSAITIAGSSTSLGGSITTATILSGTGVFSGSAQIPNSSISNAQLANSSVTVTAGTGLSGGGSVSLGGSVTISNAGVTAFNTRTGAVTLASTDISGLGAGIFSGSAQIPNSSITNAQLVNSTISGIALGSNLATLTIGTGLSGTSYNGSGAVTITNTGVTSNVAGTGISVSGATGAVTITNTGVTSAVAGTGVSVSGATGAVTISIGQAVATSSNVQFNSLGVGTAGSGVAGEIRATADITAYYSSDERLKEDITPIENPIEKLMAIDGVTFNWKGGFEEIHSHTGADTGVIAQQVKALELPGTVTTRETGYMAVNYEKLNALLIEGFKVQQLEINALKLEMQELKAKLK